MWQLDNLKVRPDQDFVGVVTILYRVIDERMENGARVESPEASLQVTFTDTNSEELRLSSTPDGGDTVASDQALQVTLDENTAVGSLLFTSAAQAAPELLHSRKQVL